MLELQTFYEILFVGVKTIGNIHHRFGYFDFGIMEGRKRPLDVLRTITKPRTEALG